MRRQVSALVLVIAVACVSWSCGGNSVPRPAYLGGAKVTEAGCIKVLELQGSYFDMGRQYGYLLGNDLRAFYALAIEGTLVEKFAVLGLTLEDLKQGAWGEFGLYPERFKDVLRGMAATSGMALDELLVLDQLVPFSALAGAYEACSAISAWGDYTGGGPLVFGRNFDWFDYYRDFSDYLVVVVYNPDDGDIAAASVGYAGQIQTLNGINREGVFLELNAGSLSDDTHIEDPMIPTMVQLLSFLFDTSHLAQFDARFNTGQTNLGFIVNVASAERAHSYEWATYDVRRSDAEPDGLLVATNHFEHPDWGIPLPPADHSSMVRRRNLLSLGESNKGQINAQKMMEILDTEIDSGGATKTPDTVFQIVAVPRDLTLWIKLPGTQDWTRIDLRDAFAQE